MNANLPHLLDLDPGAIFHTSCEFISASYWTVIAMNCMHRWNLQGTAAAIAKLHFFGGHDIPSMCALAAEEMLTCILGMIWSAMHSWENCLLNLLSDQFLVAHQTMQVARRLLVKNISSSSSSEEFSNFHLLALNSYSAIFPVGGLEVGLMYLPGGENWE